MSGYYSKVNHHKRSITEYYLERNNLITTSRLITVIFDGLRRVSSKMLIKLIVVPLCAGAGADSDCF